MSSLVTTTDQQNFVLLDLVNVRVCYSGAQYNTSVYFVNFCCCVREFCILYIVQQLSESLDEFGEKWELNPADGAFYGPKV